MPVGYCPDPDSVSLGTEWWDDKLHSRSSSKAGDAMPPSKRKKAPLVSGILPLKSPDTGQDGAGPGLREVRRIMWDRVKLQSLMAIWCHKKVYICQDFLLSSMVPKQTGSSAH